MLRYVHDLNAFAEYECAIRQSARHAPGLTATRRYATYNE